MKDYAYFYGYDNIDFYGPLLSTGYFDILEGTDGDDPYIQLIADNEEELMRAMEEIHKVATSLGYSIDDASSKLNNLWEGDTDSIWDIYGEEIGNRVSNYLDSLFKQQKNLFNKLAKELKSNKELALLATKGGASLALFNSELQNDSEIIALVKKQELLKN